MKTEKHWSKEVKRYLKDIEQIHLNEGNDSPLDESTLYMWAENYNLYLICQKKIAEDGPVIKNEKDVTVTHPAVSTALRCANINLSLLKELGLSVKARKYITKQAEDEGGEWSDFV